MTFFSIHDNQGTPVCLHLRQVSLRSDTYWNETNYTLLEDLLLLFSPSFRFFRSISSWDDFLSYKVHPRTPPFFCWVWMRSFKALIWVQLDWWFVDFLLWSAWDCIDWDFLRDTGCILFCCGGGKMMILLTRFVVIPSWKVCGHTKEIVSCSKHHSGHRSNRVFHILPV